MARNKERITQTDFSMGSPRKESVERDDTPLVAAGLQEARNTIGLSPSALEVRPGLVHLSSTASRSGVSVDLGSGRVFDLHITETGAVMYDADDAVVLNEVGQPWQALPNRFGNRSFDQMDFWVLPDPDQGVILIGAQDFQRRVIYYDGSAWVLSDLSAITALSPSISPQPFWNYYPGVTIQPSARTGNITVTASSPIFASSHVGVEIRYSGRRINLTGYTSPTVMSGTVIEELAPTYNITLTSSSGYKVGEAVEHSTAGGQGIITNIAGNVVTVLATAVWNGFPVSNGLVGPKVNQGITAVSSVAPAPSPLWDMQLGNAVFGYAGWGVKHLGRAYLCGFPGAPQAFAASVPGDVFDFRMGANDGDGFAESLGANDGGDLKYIQSAEDLLFFTSTGAYYQQTRDQSDVTPTTIGPRRFSKIGCADVAPIAVDDGAVFVDAVGNQMYGAILSGDVYRSWRAIPISEYHSHLITGPAFLGATQVGSEWPEQFIYVVNEDGTCAVAQWERDQNRVGWRPWDTNGSFKAIYQAFGRIHAVVERTINGVTSNYRERFVTGIYLDCAACLKVSTAFPQGEVGASFFGGVTALASHLNGEQCIGYFEGWDLGDRVVAGGRLQDTNGDLGIPTHDGVLQVGLPFTMRLVPWPRRSVRGYRGERDVKRIIKLGFTIQDTLQFNFDGYSFGGYRVNEDTSKPPPLRSEEAAFILQRREPFEIRPLIMDRPGPFRLLRINYRVAV